MTTDDLVYIEKRILDRCVRDESTGCLLWTGAKTAGGYGRMMIRSRYFLVHRFMCELHHGRTDGLNVCHTCDVKLCCEPSHLFAGSHSDNMKDMISKGRVRGADRMPRRKRQSLRIPSTETLLEYLQRQTVQQADGCWVWPGMLTPDGYGKARFDGKWGKTHRLMYEALHGPIPDGMSVLHSCDERRCCNPEHLRLGTQRDNVQDMVERKRIFTGEKKGRPKGNDHYLRRDPVKREEARKRITSTRKLKGEEWHKVHDGTFTTGEQAWSHLNKDRLPRGENVKTSKLNEDTVRAIVSLRQTGQSLRDVAGTFGVSQSLVSAILHGRVWQHLWTRDSSGSA